MISYNETQNQITIVISNATIFDLDKYHKSLLHLLGSVEVGDCQPQFKEDLKTVYKLLTHLQLDEDFLSQHRELLKEGMSNKNVSV